MLNKKNLVFIPLTILESNNIPKMIGTIISSVSTENKYYIGSTFFIFFNVDITINSKLYKQQKEILNKFFLFAEQTIDPFLFIEQEKDLLTKEKAKTTISLSLYSHLKIFLKEYIKLNNISLNETTFGLLNNFDFFNLLKNTFQADIIVPNYIDINSLYKINNPSIILENEISKLKSKKYDIENIFNIFLKKYQNSIIF